MKHLSEEQLILYEYSKPVDRSVVEAHLAVCQRCRTEMAALGDTLKIVGSSLVPERPETYGKEVWDRVAPRLRDDAAARATRVWWPRFNWPRWAFGVAAGAVVALAFLAGRYWPRRPVLDLEPQAISEQARDRVLMAAVADHFERAQVLLTALKHAGQQGGQKDVDISFERELAEDLLTGNRLYEESALRDGQAGLASVLDDLGRTLVSVANAPAMISPTGISELRDEILQQGILFKIQVLDSRLRNSARASELTG